MAYLNMMQVLGTAAIPCIVIGGKVYSFKTETSGDKTFDGERLRVGIDGNVYAVFDDCGHAAAYDDCFAGCQPASFGQYDNAFDLGKPS